MPKVFVQSTDHPEDRGHVEERTEAEIAEHEAACEKAQGKHIMPKGVPVFHNAGLRFRRMTDDEVAAYEAAEAAKAAS